MSNLFEIFREATLLQCGFLEKLLRLDMSEVAAFSESLASFLSDTRRNKFVYGLAAGRSALSLYSFLQLLQNHFDNVFPCTLEDPVQRHFNPRMMNLGIAVSGSGETPSVNKYIEDVIEQGGEIKLITANRNGTAYRLVEDYKNGTILVIEGKTKYSTDKERRSRLSPLGTEFELEVLAFLNALFKDIQTRLDGHHDDRCPEYCTTIQDFKDNGRLIADMDQEHLERWFGRLFPRSGRYVIGGVGRSGLVARAFEMRFTHLNKISYWERDFNTPSFQIGDVYIPITGGGNTYEALEGARNAFRNGADVMPITANRDSNLMALVMEKGRLDDAVFIPVKQDYESLFKGNRSTTSWLVSEFTKYRYPIFEMNTSIFTNSVVAVGAEFLGIVEAGMRRLHV
ncbi:MAG: sugar phosphate isomerase [Methanothrix sp.]|uniref:sugar phosphate isomerase n=1 Tax=Methanothrix sp. TaxID=90426 RepID=UPI0025D85A65|nr:sugar phosphate isomerase [Methanothrix sp.]MCQ8903051.1 sugar phosphate isomerase [Methanothrix sp.]